MVRAAITFILIVFLAMLYLLFAGPVIEDIGANVKDNDATDSADADRVDQIRETMLVQVPLVLIGGMGIWAIAWYVRKELLVRRGPGGP